MNFVSVESMIHPQNPFIRLNAADNVVVARMALSAGRRCRSRAGKSTIGQAIGPGHKVAVVEIAAGETVFKYGKTSGEPGSGLRPAIWCMCIICALRRRTGNMSSRRR